MFPYLLIELFYIGMPVVWTDGRLLGVRSRDFTKFSSMSRLPHFLSYGAPPARAPRAGSQLTALAGESEVSFHFHFHVGVTYYISLHVGKKRLVLYLTSP